jgi:hypothetical protein
LSQLSFPVVTHQVTGELSWPDPVAPLSHALPSRPVSASRPASHRRAPRQVGRGTVGTTLAIALLLGTGTVLNGLASSGSAPTAAVSEADPAAAVTAQGQGGTLLGVRNAPSAAMAVPAAGPELAPGSLFTEAGATPAVLTSEAPGPVGSVSPQGGMPAAFGTISAGPGAVYRPASASLSGPAAAGPQHAAPGPAAPGPAAPGPAAPHPAAPAPAPAAPTAPSRGSTNTPPPAPPVGPAPRPAIPAPHPVLPMPLHFPVHVPILTHFHFPVFVSPGHGSPFRDSPGRDHSSGYGHDRR